MPLPSGYRPLSIEQLSALHQAARGASARFRRPTARAAPGHERLASLRRSTLAILHHFSTRVLRLAPLDWTLLAIAATVVWVAEALNTALEALSDAAVPEHSPHIALAKDVAAGAVLLASLGALAVGLLVFLPHLLARLGFGS